MKKKIIAICMCVALLAVAVIGGTLAYFTDETQKVQNTFSVGNVKITLDEAALDDSGNVTSERTEEGNDYGVMMPGSSISKDPTVHVDKTSQDAYLFVQLDLSKYASLVMMYKQLNPVADVSTLDAQIDAVLSYIDGFEKDDWTIMNEDDITASLANGNPTTLSVILGYKSTVTAGQDIVVFTGITMPADITSEMLENVPNFTTDDFNIDITAYAIQAAEIEDLDAAYAAMFPSD